ncbi:MAG: glycine--tRNA ligase subunit beta [Thiovulaceae bacterium]|nr:glycine--tRNA ligase subunit beta [Sulfurimonadaceae bacterium]
MLQPLLIEIGVEELPAIPLLKELPNIESKWVKILEKYALLGEFEFHFTPRRLVLWHAEFLEKQRDSSEELFGAPVEIAFKDGVPTPAALGFAKKCGVDISEVQRNEKGGKEVLYFKKELIGKDSIELIPTMITEFINALSFGKNMRWGSNSESFIRPVRWLGVMLGNDTVDCSFLDVRSSNKTYVHRQKSFEAQSYQNPKAFFDILIDGGVDLFSKNREATILDQFKSLEAKHKINIDINKDLLDEVVAITEHPVSLVGNFSQEFLELPNEVVITSMREHQRYFPVYENGTLSNKFIVVSNAICSDYTEVIKGNEKVLHARLSDGLFFYHNDLKRGLINDGLEKVTFMKGLGSLHDKLNREEAIALELFDDLGMQDSSNERLTKEFFAVSKADLMSEMVYEFTELQGVMGFYYAKKLGLDERIAHAIKEQYLPDGEESDLPSSQFAAVVAIAVKLDTIMSLFSINQIPTGSRDPFALRRAVNGIIRITIEHNLALNITTLLETNKELYKDFDLTALENFFLERLNTIYNVNTSIIKSVIESGERTLIEMDQKIKAVNSIAQSDQFKNLSSVFKRVSNITKDMDLSSDLSVDPKIFEGEFEKRLFDAFSKVQASSYTSYEEELDALTGLTPALTDFFDNVMVNADDEKLKNNRKNLVASVAKAFRKIADIKEITI